MENVLCWMATTNMNILERRSGCTGDTISNETTEYDQTDPVPTATAAVEWRQVVPSTTQLWPEFSDTGPGPTSREPPVSLQPGPTETEETNAGTNCPLTKIPPPRFIRSDDSSMNGPSGTLLLEYIDDRFTNRTTVRSTFRECQSSGRTDLGQKGRIDCPIHGDSHADATAHPTTIPLARGAVRRWRVILIQHRGTHVRRRLCRRVGVGPRRVRRRTKPTNMPFVPGFPISFPDDMVAYSIFRCTIPAG